MPIEVFTGSKTGILPKNDDIPIIVVSKLVILEVDANNAIKIVEHARIDKIVELTGTLTDGEETKEAGLIDKEVIDSSINVVLGTSISDTWSWEVAGED